MPQMTAHLNTQQESSSRAKEPASAQTGQDCADYKATSAGQALPAILRRAQSNTAQLRPSDVVLLQRTLGNRTTASLLTNLSRGRGKGEDSHSISGLQGAGLSALETPEPANANTESNYTQKPAEAAPIPSASKAFFQQTGGQVLSRAPDPAPATAPQVKFGPLTVGGAHESWQSIHDRQQIKKDARARLPAVARQFIDEAFSAAQNGARTAARPPDPVVKENFERALAGNLLWAATSLFAEWNPIVIPMSFLGSIVGSGGGAAASPDFGLGEKAIADNMAREADHAHSLDIGFAEAAAEECGQKSIRDAEEQDQLMWRRMFPPSSTTPGVPYETRLLTITTRSRVRVEAALADFVKQWTAWQERVERCKSTPIFSAPPPDELAQGPSNRQTSGVVQTMRSGVVRRQFIPVVPFMTTEECERRNPFSPVLHF